MQFDYYYFLYNCMLLKEFCIFFKIILIYLFFLINTAATLYFLEEVSSNALIRFIALIYVLLLYYLMFKFGSEVCLAIILEYQDKLWQADLYYRSGDLRIYPDDIPIRIRTYNYVPSIHVIIADIIFIVTFFFW